MEVYVSGKSRITNSSVCDEIARILTTEPDLSRENVNKIKMDVCKKYKVTHLPKNSDILARLEPEQKAILLGPLRTKPTRSLSGVTVIAVMTKPYPCPPQAKCVFCPGGPRISTPKSYTKGEPATMRAVQNEYDPYQQVSSRMRQLSKIGHDISKSELIILGGTFLGYPLSYQKQFVKLSLDALNEVHARDLEEAKAFAEKARVRNVGLTIETRPDFCREEHVDLMLSYGTTRIELGVQILDDNIYQKIGRGHTVKDVRSAIKVAKDSAFKIVAHMMPGLPGSTPKKDLESFRLLFRNPSFMPDMIKIYPTLVLESSLLYNWYKEGKYVPYDTATVVKLLSEVKKIVPRWMRIMRIQRNIPAYEIRSGVKKGNVRELIKQEMSKRGYSCRCIRCREIGLRSREGSFGDLESIYKNVTLLRQDYTASEGLEIFLSYEDPSNDILIGFLRLRKPSDSSHRSEIANSNVCLVRELHVYGTVTPLGINDSKTWQHRGFGESLMAEAERIAGKELHAKKMVVISALGTKEYYKKLGYHPQGPYMVKAIN